MYNRRARKSKIAKVISILIFNIYIITGFNK